MGVLDFLSDLSKAGKKDELGLGGMRSLLGTRGAAPQGERGDEMMSRTSSDSLPGYFDPETREYVPWYVDLFDGGGLNRSEGLLGDAQKVTTAVDMLDTKRAPVQRAGQMAPGLGSQLSDMEMANRNRVAQMAPGLGGQLSDMERANRNRASQVARNDAIYSARVQEAKRERDNYESNSGDPRLKMESTGYSIPPDVLDFYTRKTDLGAAGYGPMEQAFAPASAATPFNFAPESTPRLSEMQSPMMQHPAFPQFVDIMKRAGNESVLQNPEQASFVFNNYLKQIGYK